MTIHAYSTALFSTWINIEELGLLLDAGDGVAASLLQKTGKIKHIFISHPDRDHLMGLFQLNSLNARKGLPIIYYPKNCGTFPAMQDFHQKFDKQVLQTQWLPISANDQLEIRNDYYVEALRNEHIKAPLAVHKSLSFKIYQTKQKLKPEFLQLNSKELSKLTKEKGKDFITDTIHTNRISYSADTPVDDYEKWNNSEILIHEATFLETEERQKVISKEGKHSQLDEVIKMVSEIKVGQLILSHFSPRYSHAEIKSAVVKCCKAYQLKIPVRIIYPGQVHHNLLSDEPVYE